MHTSAWLPNSFLRPANRFPKTNIWLLHPPKAFFSKKNKHDNKAFIAREQFVLKSQLLLRFRLLILFL